MAKTAGIADGTQLCLVHLSSWSWAVPEGYVVNGK